MKRALLTLILTVALFLGMVGVQPVMAAEDVTLSSGGWSAPVGSWDPATGVATLTEDIASLTIDPSIALNVTVDGNGHSVIGSGVIDSVGVNITGWSAGYQLTVRNLVVSGFTDGILLSGSTGVTLESNSVSGCANGIHLANSSDNTVSGNTVGEGATNSGIITSGIYVAAGGRNTLANNSASGHNYGIYLNNSSNNTVGGKTTDFGNTTDSNTTYGIYVYGGGGNTLANNSAASNSYDGIRLKSSDSNTLTDNVLSSNRQTGLFVESCTASTLNRNDMDGNRYDFHLDGSSDRQWHHTIDTSNTVGGRPILYVDGADGRTYDASTIDAGTVYLVDCKNVKLTGMTLSGNYAGVYLWYTSESKIENVQTTNNYVGIYMRGPSDPALDGNTVLNNTIERNDYGMYLYISYNNHVYGNQFLGSTRYQAYAYGATGTLFNEPRPVGGNYWSNFTSPDGDGDGFVDNPYRFTGGQDELPLTNPPSSDIDTTPPVTKCELAGTSGANGWYTSAVQVTLSADDPESGVQCTEYSFDNQNWTRYQRSFSVSEDGQRTLYYRSLNNDGVLESAKSVNINIDMTAPTVTASATNEDGPYTADTWTSQTVTVHFACSDGTSGVDSCPADVELAGEGITDSVVGSGSDIAGNSASAAFGPIKIDKTAPTLTWGTATPAANAAGWNNKEVSIPFTAADGLSGVATTSPTSPLVLAAEGNAVTGTVTVTDAAGNSKTFTSAAFNIDVTAPTVTASATNEDGTAYTADTWTKQTVTVHFACSDGTSGVDSCPADVELADEGITDSVARSGSDIAGNSASAAFGPIKIDKTPPDTVGTAFTPQSGPGWYNTDVEVVWSATDTLSGVDPNTVPAPSYITGEGTGLGTEATGKVYDLVGNADAIASVTGINIDRVAPTISIKNPPEALASVAVRDALEFSADDTLSGVATVTGVLSGSSGSQNVESGYVLPDDAVGVHTLEVTATDLAGNVATQLVEFVVYDPYNYRGFVTGGAWYTSAPGAYVADPTLTGKVSCSFVSKYDKKLKANGETELHFQAANIDFHSTAYDSLVISGTKATFKGTGTINGGGSYSFMIVAIDNDPDCLRIKITDNETGATVYDTGQGADDTSGPTTAIDGGSISVKKG